MLFQDVHVPALQPWTQITSKGPSPQLALPSLGSNIAAHGRTSKRFFLSTPSHPCYFGNFHSLFWELDIVAVGKLRKFLWIDRGDPNAPSLRYAALQHTKTVRVVGHLQNNHNRSEILRLVQQNITALFVTIIRSYFDHH